MSNNPVVILGGGMTGLSLAYYLHKIGGPVLNGRKIIVLEGNKQLGGWLKTNTFADGVIHELGPRSVRFAPKLGINTMNMVSNYLKYSSYCNRHLIDRGHWSARRCGWRARDQPGRFEAVHMGQRPDARFT